MEVKRLLLLVLLIFTVFCILLIKVPHEYQEEETRGKLSWEEIQQERRKRVESVCSKYPGLELQEIDYRLFKYSPSYHLMFCANAKVGSTTYLLTTFKQISEGEKLEENIFPEGPVLSKKRKETGMTFSNKKLIRDNLDMEDNVSFMVVRHPFERLVSAFRHKSFQKLYGLGKLNFDRFLQEKVVGESEKCLATKFCLNVHWKPYIACNPCRINYTVISKMETFEEDREKIHQLIGLPYKSGVQYHDMKEITGSGLSTEDWTKLFFKNITKELKGKLIEIFKYDFEMYNYDPFKY